MRDDDLWVFGYGSLMWDPGFTPSAAVPALLKGYHRAFALYSVRSWGSPEHPGLVLALLPGGSCRGRAFRVPAPERRGVLGYLDERENAYVRREVPVRHDGGTVRAVAYVADADHHRFAGKLEARHAARLIRQGVGEKGASRDYLANTVRHLEDLGIDDTALHALLELSDALDGDGG